jgi:ribosomal protein S1
MVEGLTVVNISNKTGLIVQFPPVESIDDTEKKVVTQPSYAVLIPKKQLGPKVSEVERSEEEEAKKSSINEEYEVGNVLDKVRISGYHLIEGLCVGSNLANVLDSSVIHCSDIAIGQCHDVEITSIKDFGLTCKIADKISAVCPKLHVSDVVVDVKLNKKFKVGQNLRMRVWEATNGAIILTNKKTLIDLKDGYLANYDDATVGKLAVGVIAKITDSGISVRFFNKLQGEIPTNVLTKQGVLNPDESFRVGQVIKTVIIDKNIHIRADKNQQFVRLTLALELNVTAANMAEYQALIEKKVVDSQSLFVSGTVISIGSETINVRLDDSRTGIIHKHHLFDFSSTSKTLFSTFPIGQRIIDALIIGHQNKSLLLSLKPLLKAAVTTDKDQMKLPKRIAELSPGDIVAGVVAKVESYGVIVRLNDKLTALAPRPSIADRFVSTPVGLFSEGDSVRCVIQRVDLQKERAIVSLKPSTVPKQSTDSLFLRSWFKERFLMAQHLAAHSKKLLPAWGKYTIGGIVSCKVASNEEYGVVLFADDQTTVLVDKSPERRKAKAGENVKALILDIDLDNSVVEVKVLDKMSAKRLKEKFSPSAEVSFEAIIEAVKEKYLIVSKNDFVGFVAIADYNNPKPEMLDFQAGGVVQVKLWCQPSCQGAAEFPHAQVATLQLFNEKSNVMKKFDDNNNDFNVSHASDDIKTPFTKLGEISSWVVESVYPNEMKVVPNLVGVEGVHGIVHVSSLCASVVAKDDLAKKLKAFVTGEDRTAIHSLHPFYTYSVGQKLDCQVLQVRKEKNEVDGSFVVHVRVVNNIKLDEIPVAERLLQHHGDNEISAPSIHQGVVTRINPGSCTVALSPYIATDLPFIEISNDAQLVRSFKDRCYVGLRVTVAVLSVSKEHKMPVIKLSRAAIESLLKKAGDTKLDAFQGVEKAVENYGIVEEGSVTAGMINFAQKVPRGPAIAVSLRGNKFGRLCLSEIADPSEWSDLSSTLSDIKNDRNRLNAQLPNGLGHGSVVSCRVLSVTDNVIEISLRKSRLVSFVLNLLLIIIDISKIFFIVSGLCKGKGCH